MSVKKLEEHQKTIARATRDAEGKHKAWYEAVRDGDDERATALEAERDEARAEVQRLEDRLPPLEEAAGREREDQRQATGNQAIEQASEHVKTLQAQIDKADKLAAEFVAVVAEIPEHGDVKWSGIVRKAMAEGFMNTRTQMPTVSNATAVIQAARRLRQIPQNYASREMSMISRAAAPKPLTAEDLAQLRQAQNSYYETGQV